MKTSSRRILGAVLLGISLAVALVLYLSGAPLLSVKELKATSFPGGYTKAALIEIHWPLAAVCVSGLIGLVAFAWPQRKPPRLQL